MPAEQLPAPAKEREHPAHPATVLGPNAVPLDPELGAKRLNRTPSRASLPRSVHSHRSGMHDMDGEEIDDDHESEVPWGPQHPCYPHPNPHVPIDSTLYDTTRIIRVKRNWMVKGDLAPTFGESYPVILEEMQMLSEDDFWDLIKKINDSLVDAFNPFGFRAWLDSIMGVATFWLWDDAGLTKVKKDLAALDKWMEDWNHRVGEREGVRLIPLRRTGYLTLDIQIPDPGIEPNGNSRPGTQEDDVQESSKHYEGYDAFHNAPTFHVTANSPQAIQTQS